MCRGGKKALADGLQNGLCFHIFPYAKPHGAIKLKPNMSRNNIYAFLDMGLCPIAPPKGFPVALWKPSGAYT